MTIDSKKLVGISSIKSTQLLSAILTVLVDMHCKGMNDIDRNRYQNDLAKKMTKVGDELIDYAKS